MKAKLSKKESEEILKFIVSTAELAGKKLLRFQKKLDSLNVTNKQAQGVASEADHASEVLIMKPLRRNFPAMKY